MSSRRAWQRLMNLNGGYLKYYGSYSNAQLQESFPLTYGSRAASLPSEIANASLYVLFGNNFSSTRPSGSGKGYQIDAAMERKRPRTIVIDPCYTDTAATHADQWIPIRPGTDAALVGALAYEFIRNGWIDQKFLDTYCVGFDAKTLPASAPKGSDYRSYILGEGPDRTPKTPEWASRITGIPVDTIKALAKELGTTKPVFVSQGWGPQRQANGEETARAIAMVPILLGQVGLPGTNSGEHEGNTPFPAVYLPVFKNPVKASIPVFMWTDAILRGTEMSRTTDGVKGVEKLSTNIKMIVNSGGNTLINQHGDSNWTHKILQDESKVEFIIVCDNMMTPSCRYADVLLPDTLGPVFPPYDAASNRGCRAVRIENAENGFDVYFNGGSPFVPRREGKDFTVMAAYGGAERAPAVISVACGAGRVVLSGVHFEYAPERMNADDVWQAPLRSVLQKSEAARVAFINDVAEELRLERNFK